MKFNHYESLAVRLGYRVVDDGQGVISPRGERLSVQTKGGYLQFKAGQDKWVRVHRVVALEKFGEVIYAPGIVVRHLDGNSKNNTASNLAIGTQHDNAMDRSAEDRRAHALKAGAAVKKHDHDAIRSHYAARGFMPTVREYGISRSVLSYIINYGNGFTIKGRACKTCGQAFQTKLNYTKFCSVKCRKASYHKACADIHKPLSNSKSGERGVIFDAKAHKWQVRVFFGPLHVYANASHKISAIVAARLIRRTLHGEFALENRKP